MAADRDLLAEEDGYAKKGQVCWRNVGYGRHCFASNFRAESSQQADMVRSALAKRGRMYVAQSRKLGSAYLREMWDKAPIPIDRGKGAPFFESASDRGAGLLLALLGRKVMDYDEMNDLLKQSSGVDNLMLMYGRVQAAGKLSSWRGERSGRIVALGDILQPKARTVKAPPFAENNKNAAAYDLHKKVCLSVLGHIHTTDIGLVVRTLSAHKYVWSTDLSTCDDTIGLQLLQAMRTEVLIPLWTCWRDMGVFNTAVLNYLIAYDEHINVRDILAPARTKFEAGCVISMIGGNKSGERGTTMKTIDCVGARNDTIEALCAMRGVVLHYFSWGDDVIWYSNDPRAQDAWRQARDDTQSHLWVEKEDGDASYLMTRARYGYGYLMRQATRKINREAREEADDVVGCALSLRASYDKLTGPTGISHPQIDSFWDLFSGIPRLQASVMLARSHTYNELVLAYAAAKRTIKTEKRVEFDDDLLEGEALAAAQQLQESGLVHDRRTGLDLGRNVTELDLMALLPRWSTTEILKMLRRKL
jgi:hypothetical protein